MWIFNEKDIDETILKDYVGFVYQITNLTNGRRYIGKKLLKTKRTKVVSGKRKKVIADSDWKKYWSSSDELKNDVKELGEHNFKREILQLCKTKSECNYYEAFLQFQYGVLLSNSWYNQWIMARISKKHLKKNLT